MKLLLICFSVFALFCHVRAWTALDPNTECNAAAGEVWRGKSSGLVKDIDECKKSCEDEAECKSITFFSNSNWCSHFTTACTKTKTSQWAISMRLSTSGQ